MKDISQVIRACFCICVLEGFVALAPLPASAQQGVTLDEAVDKALARSPQMLQQDQSVDNAALARRSAWAAFIPTLSGNTSGSLRSANVLDPNTGQIIPGSSDSYSAGLSARVDLFRGGSRFLELDQTDANMEAAVARREAQLYAVTLQTKNLFFTALRQADLLDVSNQRVEQAQQNLDIVRARAQVGRATISDSLRARLDLVNARQAVLQGETALRASRFALGRQVGEAAPVQPVRPDGLDPTPLGMTEEEIMQLAEAASPAVVAADYFRRAAASEVTVSKSAYLPTISMSTGYNWNNQIRSLTGGSTSWSLGLNMSYPIWNGFQRESTVDRAQFSLRVASLQEEDARLAARQEADAALQDLRTAEAAIQIALEAAAVAAEDLRVVRARFEVGAATSFDMIISQTAADQANIDVVTSRYDYLLARAALSAILGREM
ncbi:MAG: TolC family protein [Gemmatimonadales bacterium]|jgi:outer membrane protein TolC|nr:TolC family protein [Gemmatimonadales bacterium]MBT3776206.1 TolC family protein [Gemmatimonadales bacterium]MBT3959329.1 TolC family protein [Gemmatimonadales bacterium]MBT4437929.1 TolC family protein [Gemmatimonadales bacterium]MBT4912804.1 TolC family protein [Gemmatimonadales bacterium]